MMKFACQESDKNVITIDAVFGAIKLVEYFKKSSVKVYSIIADVNPLTKFSPAKQNLYKALPESFSTDEGYQIAKKFNVPERTYKRFLSEEDIFIRVSQGNYEKRI
jgi:hypothetical protein